MSLTASLYIGSSGLAINQKGIEVTGNNVSNLNTAGYSKQTLEVGTSPTLEYGGQMIGSGSTVSGISRETSVFVSRQLTAKNAEYGEESARSLILAEIEQIIDVEDGSLSTHIDEFFDAWQELSTDPSATLERQQVMQTGENLAEDFQSLVSDLASVSDSIDTDLEGKITSLNQQLQQIADLNVQIVSAESTGISANALRDERDLLLQEVSQLAGVSYYEESNGMLSLQLAGGQPLVTADTVSTLSTQWNAGTLEVTLNSGASTLTLDGDDFGGELGGMLELRDEYIPQLVEQLDILAYNLATAVNSVHSAGVDGDGNSGGDFFSFSSSGSEPWDGAASTLTMALTDTAQVAAGLSDEVGDNENALNLVALQNSALVDGTSTLNAYFATIAADVGLTVSQNSTALESADDTLTQLQNMRDAVCGVSTDEEMLLLVQYQSGYEAAAKYLTAVDEMLDTLMSM
ncbi:MAG: flagellar hook-associated protein FlgK [Desulfuromonadaceae bacterium]|nr:flagellar hook-associated protein FlgK [Desulfuromonadaceae bacterium]